MTEFFEIVEQKPSTQKEAKRRTVSFSQWSDWYNCPLQWKLKNIDKFRSPTVGIAAIFGTAMHQTIQDWLKIHYADEKRARSLDMSDKLKEYLFAEFQKNVVTNEDGSKTYPCEKAELIEHYKDGWEILKHLRKYGKEFFPTKKHKLLGVEIPLEFEIGVGLRFKAYLDIIIHDVENDIYRIIDLKTSTKGWSDRFQKKDPKKVNQVLLYKKFYSQVFAVPEDKISPEFIILKRKILENTQWPMKRLSYFKPSHGKVSLNNAITLWNNFLNESFDSQGMFTGKAAAKPSKDACKFCEFKLDKERCPTGYYKE